MFLYKEQEKCKEIFEGILNKEGITYKFLEFKEDSEVNLSGSHAFNGLPSKYCDRTSTRTFEEMCRRVILDNIILDLKEKKFNSVDIYIKDGKIIDYFCPEEYKYKPFGDNTRKSFNVLYWAEGRSETSIFSYAFNVYIATIKAKGYNQ